MKKAVVVMALCAAVVAGSTLPALAAKAKSKISAKQAQAAALKAHPKGKISGKTKLENEDGKLVCISRLTLAVVPRQSPKPV